MLEKIGQVLNSDFGPGLAALVIIGAIGGFFILLATLRNRRRHREMPLQDWRDDK